jgi:hypothetical protein
MLRVRSTSVRRVAASIAGAALALTGTAAAATAATTSTLATGLTAPSGTIETTSAPTAAGVTTTSTWVADHLLGFCRLDPTATGLQINQATCLTNAIAPGQPAYDATRGLVYVPDLSAKSQGVWRYAYNSTTNKFGSPTLLNVTAPQRGNRPAGAALNGGGDLYFTTLRGGGILRVTAPFRANGAAGQAMSNVARTSDQGGAASLTFLKGTLYIAENGAVTSISTVNQCASTARCIATDAGIAFTPRSLANNGVDTVYVGTNFDVEQYVVGVDDAATQVATPFANAASLNVSPTTGTLVVGDDPTDGALSLKGRLFQVTLP